MNLRVQKKLAAKVLKVSPKRVKFVDNSLSDISEAMTKDDLRSLVVQGSISKIKKKGVSRARANEILKQKRKGLRKGAAHKKGKPTSRVSGKKLWMSKIRVQRSFLKELRILGYLDVKTFRDLYLKAKGGFFRNKRHIKIYMEDHDLFTKVKGDSQ